MYRTLLWSTPQPSYSFHQFLITRMRVADGSQRTHMPGKSLGEEKIPRPPVNIRHRRVPERVEGWVQGGALKVEPDNFAAHWEM